MTVLKQSNFVTWPEPGGYLDQSIEWVDDILTYLALERRARWEHDEGYQENDAEPVSHVESIPLEDILD